MYDTSHLYLITCLKKIASIYEHIWISLLYSYMYFKEENSLSLIIVFYTSKHYEQTQAFPGKNFNCPKYHFIYNWEKKFAIISISLKFLHSKIEILLPQWSSSNSSIIKIFTHLLFRTQWRKSRENIANFWSSRSSFIYYFSTTNNVSTNTFFISYTCVKKS